MTTPTSPLCVGSLISAYPTNLGRLSTQLHLIQDRVTMTEYKLVVLGCCTVGKSGLIIRFLQNCFVEESEHIVSDLYHGQVVVDGEPCQLAIMDTSGRELYEDLPEDCIFWGQGFLFVYMVDSISTFMDLSLFWDEVEKVKGTALVPIVLVANKVDEFHWIVKSKMGQEVAKIFGVPYMETSAKTGQGVEQTFQELVREIRRSQDQGHLLFVCSSLASSGALLDHTRSSPGDSWWDSSAPT